MCLLSTALSIEPEFPEQITFNSIGISGKISGWWRRTSITDLKGRPQSGFERRTMGNGCPESGHGLPGAC